MLDLLIREARIIDGTGSPEYVGDLGIEGDQIVAVGAVAGGARREIAAANYATGIAAARGQPAPDPKHR